MTGLVCWPRQDRRASARTGTPMRRLAMPLAGRLERMSMFQKRLKSRSNRDCEADGAACFLREVDAPTRLAPGALMDGSCREPADTGHIALVALVSPTMPTTRWTLVIRCCLNTRRDRRAYVCSDLTGKVSQSARETSRRIVLAAAHDQAVELRRLWAEFEAQQTPEACFAMRWIGCCRCCTTCGWRRRVGTRTAAGGTDARYENPAALGGHTCWRGRPSRIWRVMT
jgi:hypothetical protein